MGRWTTLALLLVIGGLAGLFWFWRPPSPPSAESPTNWFEEITQASGLRFLHDPGPFDSHYFMPQIVGSGGAFLDANNDGRLDILLLNNGGPSGRPNALFLQQPDGSFRDASADSGLDYSAFCMGCAVGDLNNDGLVDVVITEFGKLRLFLNQGEGKFVYVASSGLESVLWGTSACFIDFDRDGWLDLVVANYVHYDPSTPCIEVGGLNDYCHPNVFSGTVAKLYRNRSGDKAGGAPGRVRFEDVTAASGVAAKPGPGLGVACADFNGDGWPDIFVANDGKANHLWINQKDGTFTEEAIGFGVAYDGVGRPLANMGIALGDTRGSGLFDLFVTHLPEETNTLWRQEPRGIFSDCTGSSNLLRAQFRATGFGTILADFNQDGRLDLAIVNGRVSRRRDRPTKSADPWDAYRERNQLFVGEAEGRFRDVSTSSPVFCGTPSVARALIAGDVDSDGAIDLLVTAIAGPAKLYRNVAPERGHWLMVRAFDPALKRDAYGAEITVEASGRKAVSWVLPGQSYLASNDPHAHFGLGSRGRYDGITVLWPDGILERFPGGQADRRIELRKGEGTPNSAR